jgi:lysozyme
MTAALWDGSVPPAATVVAQRIETFRAAPYDDGGGTWTYGWGSTRDVNGVPVTAATPPIAQAHALALLQRDMGAAAAAVRRLVRVILHTHEAAALISWTYNLGEGNLARSTMLAALNAERRQDVPAQMALWIYDAGRPSLGLRRRRWAEAAIFTGLDPTQAVDRAWAEIGSIEDWPAIA